MQFVLPKIYFVGFSEINMEGLESYLRDSGNEVFLESVEEARKAGISTAEILCSTFGKLCYKSLSEGKNLNITKVRSIEGNLRGCFDVGHGSIFEHVMFNFIISDCSRVFTHELVRHRIGTAFSQNSGRYIRLENISLVFDPILDGTQDLIRMHLKDTEYLVYKLECIKGLRRAPPVYPDCDYMQCIRSRMGGDKNWRSFQWIPNDAMDQVLKKKLTSAIRRIAPNGQANEMGFSVNLRSLRHTIMMRTGRHSEWEIRYIFEKLYLLLKDKYPTIFHGAREEIVDGIIEVSGMRTQPYEKTAEVLLDEISDEQLEVELRRRKISL